MADLDRVRGADLHRVSYLLIPNLAGDGTLWWKLSAIITCGTLAGAIIPEAIKVFTSTESRHVREVVTACREGGASLNVISGLVAGNFSAYWMGIIIAGLMGVAFWFSTWTCPTTLMLAPAVFAFGLVAFGFLGMGPVTIAVDSYGPVTDNAQSVYELSLIENVPNVKEEVQKDFGFTPDFEKGKEYLEENDGAGNTFKATAKPVLIGTAVVGATTMIFSIIVLLVGITTSATAAARSDAANAATSRCCTRPFLLGLVTGGAVIYWFSGASMQAVSTGAYRAVEFIKANIKLEGVEKASVEDSKRVVEICTQYAQKGMLNIFLGVFFSTLAFACARAVLLRRLPHLHRHLRPVPGRLHGERRWRVGQREEAGGDGAARPRARTCTRPRWSATPWATRSRTPRPWRSTRSSSSPPSSACSRWSWRWS